MAASQPRHHPLGDSSFWDTRLAKAKFCACCGQHFIRDEQGVCDHCGVARAMVPGTPPPPQPQGGYDDGYGGNGPAAAARRRQRIADESHGGGGPESARGPQNNEPDMSREGMGWIDRKVHGGVGGLGVVV